MVSFYKVVIKNLQENLPLDNEFLKALTYLNPREQNSSKSKEYCKTVASQGMKKSKLEMNGSDIKKLKLMMMTFKDVLIISGTGSSIFLTNVETFLKFFLK